MAEHFYRKIAINRSNLKDICPLLVGEEQCKPDHTFGPAIRKNYLLHFVLSGRGVLYTEHGTYPVHQNQAFLIRPQEVTTYTADHDDPWHYVWVWFVGSLCQLLDERGIVVFDVSPDIIRRILACEWSSPMRELHVAGVLLELFATLLKDRRVIPSHAKDAKNYLDMRYMYPISIDQVAHLLSLDRRYLSRLFKNAYGISMQKYLITLRISEAKQLLARGYNVKQSAKMVGYEDAFLFSKLFKKYTGISPKTYALQNQNE